MITHTLIGELAGILAFIPCPFYVYSILKGRTKPDRVTWWVLTLVSAMITASYYASGARETIWFPAGYTLSFFIVAIFSIKYGDGPVHLHTLDRVALGGALVSAVVWASLKSPVPALFLNILTELIGLWPTIYKSINRPETEDRTAWVITTIASLVNLFAISEWTLIIATYPLYSFISNSMITYLLVRPRTTRPTHL